MRRLTLTAALLCTLLISACTKDQASADNPPELPESTTQSNKAEPKTNERGNIPKKLEEEAGVTYSRSEPSVVFSIDQIDVDPECYEHGIKPDNGHTLLLHVRVATSDEQAANRDAGLLLTPYNFAVLGSDGVTKPAAMGMCTDPDGYLPTEFGANQKYRGTIELVVPETSGTVILNNYGGRGWEWTYPASK